MVVPLCNVPADRVADHAYPRMVVRTADPARLVARWPRPPQGWYCVQLLGLPQDVDCLIHWGDDLAIDIRLEEPAARYPELYRYAALATNHPVRVSMPVVDGFSDAVRLCISLQFAVKLEPGQPTAIAEMAEVLDLYLHQATTAQAVDYFHEILLGWVHATPVDLWTVLDEDPAAFLHVTDTGSVTFAPRLAGASGEAAGFVDRWRAALADGACGQCPYERECGGYFKWPRTEYDCTGVRTLFATLHEAAGQLRQDLARFQNTRGEPHGR